jgi:hypothetical protein
LKAMRFGWKLTPVELVMSALFYRRAQLRLNS